MHYYVRNLKRWRAGTVNAVRRVVERKIVAELDKRASKKEFHRLHVTVDGKQRRSSHGVVRHLLSTREDLAISSSSSSSARFSFRFEQVEHLLNDDLEDGRDATMSESKKRLTAASSRGGPSRAVPPDSVAAVPEERAEAAGKPWMASTASRTRRRHDDPEEAPGSDSRPAAP